MDINVGKKILNLSNQIKRNMLLLSKKTGLAGTQGHVLHFIIANKKEDIIQKDIEEEFNMRPATATGILKNLERDGYITRAPMQSDARLKKITLADKSLAISKMICDEIEIFDQRLIAGLTPEEIKTITALLDKISRNIED